MSEGTELQVLLVGDNKPRYSEGATLLRNAGYVVVKCSADQVAERVQSFRVDAVVLETEMSETLQILRSLPPAIDPASVLVISGAPSAIDRMKRGVVSVSPAALGDELVQAIDVMLSRRMFARDHFDGGNAIPALTPRKQLAA